MILLFLFIVIVIKLYKLHNIEQLLKRSNRKIGKTLVFEDHLFKSCECGFKLVSLITSGLSTDSSHTVNNTY